MPHHIRVVPVRVHEWSPELRVAHGQDGEARLDHRASPVNARRLLSTDAMEGSGGREPWQDAVVENRVRIDGLERESERHRVSIHELRASVAGVALLAARITTLTEEIAALGERLERLSRRALERPTSSTWANVWQFAAVVIAGVALYVALRP